MCDESHTHAHIGERGSIAKLFRNYSGIMASCNIHPAQIMCSHVNEAAPNEEKSSPYLHSRSLSAKFRLRNRTMDEAPAKENVRFDCEMNERKINITSYRPSTAAAVPLCARS